MCIRDSISSYRSRPHQQPFFTVLFHGRILSMENHFRDFLLGIFHPVIQFFACQPVNRHSLSVCICNPGAVIPVSYTHLDVYKRQATDGTCGFHLITHVTVGCGKVNCPQGKRRCPGVQPRRTASDENHIANYHGHHFYIISIERGTLTPPSANYLYHCNRRGAHCAPTVSLNGYGHSSMHRFHSHCGSTLCSPAITHLQMVKNGIMRSCRPAI